MEYFLYPGACEPGGIHYNGTVSYKSRGQTWSSKIVAYQDGEEEA